jgi:hypothetical protein
MTSTTSSITITTTAAVVFDVGAGVEFAAVPRITRTKVSTTAATAAATSNIAMTTAVTRAAVIHTRRLSVTIATIATIATVRMIVIAV